MPVSEVERLQSTRLRNATGPRHIIIKVFQAGDESKIVAWLGKGERDSTDRKVLTTQV